MAEPEWFVGSAVVGQLTFAEFKDTNKISENFHSTVGVRKHVVWP